MKLREFSILLCFKCNMLKIVPLKMCLGRSAILLLDKSISSIVSIWNEMGNWSVSHKNITKRLSKSLPCRIIPMGVCSIYCPTNWYKLSLAIYWMRLVIGFVNYIWRYLILQLMVPKRNERSVWDRLNTSEERFRRMNLLSTYNQRMEISFAFHSNHCQTMSIISNACCLRKYLDEFDWCQYLWS